MNNAGTNARRPLGLAGRLTAWYAISSFLLLFTATAFLYFALTRSFDREDSQYLVEKVRTLQTLLEEHPGQLDTVQWEVQGESLANPSVRVLSRVISPTGQVVFETTGISREIPVQAFPAPAAPGVLVPSVSKIVIKNGRRFRVLSATVGGGPSAQLRPASYQLQVAIDVTSEQDLLAGYRKQLWIVLGVGLLACIIGGYRIARRGLRPLTEISAVIGRTKSPAFDERVSAEGLPAELVQLATTFNDLMDRSNDSFDRLSRFSSDIAHELRTPVNNLRGEIDVALVMPRSTREYAELLGSLSEECEHLTRLIDSLLFLARAEHPEMHIHREDLDIKRELEVVREFYDAAATDAGIVLNLVETGDVNCSLDRTLFQRAIANLVQNALAHTPEGGRVTIEARRNQSSLAVSISDTGIGIPGEHLSRLFDRFYRVDPARSKATGGVGLGLAIIQSIAHLHGGTVEITSEVDRGTLVALRLPCPTRMSEGMLL